MATAQGIYVLARNRELQAAGLGPSQLNAVGAWQTPLTRVDGVRVAGAFALAEGVA